MFPFLPLSLFHFFPSNLFSIQSISLFINHSTFFLYSSTHEMVYSNPHHSYIISPFHRHHSLFTICYFLCSTSMSFPLLPPNIDTKIVLTRCYLAYYVKYIETSPENMDKWCFQPTFTCRTGSNPAAQGLAHRSQAGLFRDLFPSRYAEVQPPDSSLFCEHSLMSRPGSRSICL